MVVFGLETGKHDLTHKGHLLLWPVIFNITDRLDGLNQLSASFSLSEVEVHIFTDVTSTSS